MENLLLIGCLALLAFPRFAAGSVIPVNACVANLKQIDGAVQQWTLERKLGVTNTYRLDDPTLLAYLKDSTLPRCPSGGRYFPASTVAGSPRCGLHGPVDHPIDAERALQDSQGWGGTALSVVVALCGLFFALIGRGLQEAQCTCIRIVVAFTMVFAVGLSLSVLLVDNNRSAIPYLPVLFYAAAGALAFLTLRHEPRKFVRTFAFVGTGLLGTLTLLLLLVGFGELRWSIFFR